MSTVFTVDFGIAFWAIFVAIPMFLVFGAVVSLYYALKYREAWKKVRPNHSDVQLREALGDRNGTGDILAAIRDAVQKEKDAKAEAKTKTEAAEQATKDKDEAEEKLAKYRAGVASLSAKPATTDKEAFTSLDSLATISATALDVMIEQSDSFRETIEGVRAVRPVKGLLDVTDKLTGRFILEKNKVTTAVHEMDAATRKADGLEKELKLSSDSNKRLQTELDEMQEHSIKIAKKAREMQIALNELVEAGKVGDMKKIASLQADLKSFESSIKSQKDHSEAILKLQSENGKAMQNASEAANRQMVDVTKAALSSMRASNDKKDRNQGGGNGRNSGTAQNSSQNTDTAQPEQPAA